MTRADRRLLGGRSPAAFLRRYWQKRPLLIRGAVPGFRDPLSPDQLAGLACGENVESRLVLVRGGTRPFQVLPGPQDPRRLRALPPTHWTLLVQGVDRHLPAVAGLRERFRFVPDWRIDDVMVSFAPRFGTVGPHVDSYDVFLLQGLGRRRWRIQRRPDPALRPGLDLRVLRYFRPDAEWLLEPGDLLYLPPGVAHQGVALEDGLTYSIGFRARLTPTSWRRRSRAACEPSRPPGFMRIRTCGRRGSRARSGFGRSPECAPSSGTSSGASTGWRSTAAWASGSPSPWTGGPRPGHGAFRRRPSAAGSRAGPGSCAHPPAGSPSCVEPPEWTCSWTANCCRFRAASRSRLPC